MKKIICLTLSLALVLSVFAVQDNTVSAKRVKKSGTYTTATVKNTKNSGFSHPVIKKIVAKGNKITTYGSFWYGSKKLKKAKRTFKLASNCKFIYGAPPAAVKRVSKKYLISHIKSNIRINIYAEALEIYVKNGKVVKMRVLQG